MSCRPTRLRSKPAPRRGSSLSTTTKRTSGKRRKSNSRRKPSRATGQARAAAGKPRARVYISAATRLTPKMSSFFFLCSRFGGSQSSQSQAASQASERTAAPGTETAGGKAECFSEEGDDSKDFDPFLSLGESDATKCEQETSAPLVMIKAGVEPPSNVEFTSAAFFFFPPPPPQAPAGLPTSGR